MSRGLLGLHGLRAATLQAEVPLHLWLRLVLLLLLLLLLLVIIRPGSRIRSLLWLLDCHVQHLATILERTLWPM